MKVKQVTHADTRELVGYRFKCPGCERNHSLGLGWHFNGSVHSPTFYPSVLVTGRDFTPAGQAEYDAWVAADCPPLGGKQFESATIVCHSFITDGQIEFLGDCTHALAGQKVELPTIVEEVADPS